MIRDLNKYELTASQANLGLREAKLRQWKGKYLGYAGYRQQGRADARAAKRERVRARRNAGRVICRSHMLDPDTCPRSSGAERVLGKDEALGANPSVGLE